MPNRVMSMLPLVRGRWIASVGRWAVASRSMLAALAAMLAVSFNPSAVAQEVNFELVQNVQHGGFIDHVAFSPDGFWVATAEKLEVKIWEVKSSRLLRTISAANERICRIEFAPNSLQLLVSAAERITLWDISTGKKSRDVADGGVSQCEAVAFARDGRTIVHGHDDGSLNYSLLVRDASDGTVIRSIALKDKKDKQDETTQASNLAMSPDSQTVAVSLEQSKRRVQLYDVATGRLVRSMASGGEGYKAAIVYSRDGRLIAESGGYKNPVINVWDVGTGALKAVLRGHSDKIEQLVFLSDGQKLVSSSRDSTRTWSISSQKSEQVGSGNIAVALSANGKTLATAKNQISLLSAETLNLEKTLGGELDQPNRVALSSDGQYIYAAFNSGQIHEWSAVAGTLTRAIGNKDQAHKDSISSIWITAENNLVSTSMDGQIKTWSILRGEHIKGWQAHPLVNGRFHPRSAAASPDGLTAFTGGPDQLVKMWNVNSGALLKTFRGHTNDRSIIALGLSGNGERAASGTWGPAQLNIWNVKQGVKLRTIPLAVNAGPIWSLALDHTGDQVVWSIRESLFLSDAKGVHRLQEEAGSSNYLSWLDNSTVLEANASNLVKAWDIKTRKVKWSFTDHVGSLESLAVAGDLVASAGADGIRLWRMNERKTLVRLLRSYDGEWLAITPEGFFNASQNGGKLLHVVNGLETHGIDQVYQVLYRPDLVREKLAGDPKGLVREAAARLDLNKVMASGAAPKVSILTPAGNVANDELTVEASIAEQNGGGIGKVEWRVNGVTMGIEARGLERLPEGTASSPVVSRPAVTVKRTLSLEPGENRIEVVAHNGRNLIASDPAQVVLTWDGEKSATPPKLHVLAVGVNDYYDSRLKLSYAVPDARALGDALKKAGASMYGAVEVTTVMDDKVTVDNLDTVFAEVSRKVHPRDVFVFFLAGHGKTVDGRYHFLPQNFRYENEESIARRGIDQDRFQAWFARIAARKSILLYDTCESGSLTGDRVQQRGIERVAALEKMTRAMGRTVLSASSDDAPALEGYRGHGVFTYALLDGMAGADANGNGLIEVTELAAFIDQQVPDLSFKAFNMRQIPQMKIVGNSFPVVSKTAVLDVGGAKAEAKATLSIPIKPTHVVVAQSPVDIYAAAARSGAVVQTLPPGTTVTLIEGANGWQLIAKDGQKLGFIEDKALARLQ